MVVSVVVKKKYNKEFIIFVASSNIENETLN